MEAVNLRQKALEQEWAAQLRAQGVEPNGTPEERELGERLLAHRGRAQRSDTPAQALNASARAYERARRKRLA